MPNTKFRLSLWRKAKCKEFSPPHACGRGRGPLGFLAAMTHYYVFRVVCAPIIHFNKFRLGFLLNFGSTPHSAANVNNKSHFLPTPPFPSKERQGAFLLFDRRQAPAAGRKQTHETSRVLACFQFSVFVPTLGEQGASFTLKKNH
jgi:hypothetical protein